MGQNKTKEKIAAGEPVFGYILSFPAPNLAETAGDAGLDFIMLDCEHGSITSESVEDMIRGAEVVGVTPLVRVPANREEVILSFMDRGAMGVIVPHVNTRQDAEAAVAAVKFAPQGQRGMGGGRSLRPYRSEENVYAAANRETMVVCMVEEQEGVNNLDSIIDVPGVDVIHIGSSDLSQSLGYVGQTQHPKVLETIDHIIRTVKARPGPFPAVGIGGQGGGTNIPLMKSYAEKGVQFFTLAATGLLVAATRRMLQEMEGKA
ncbi:MAG: aldolase/citrate lyase family protein [Chloroflexota bacterium]